MALFTHAHNVQYVHNFPIAFPNAVLFMLPKFLDVSTSLTQTSIMYSAQSGANQSGRTTFVAIGY